MRSTVICVVKQQMHESKVQRTVILNINQNGEYIHTMSFPPGICGKDPGGINKKGMEK